MKEPGRLIGLDVGQKRTGLARTDPMRMFVAPVGTFSQEEVYREISRQIKHEGPVIGIVVGWPTTPQGGETNATALARGFVKQLRHDYPSVPVYTMDERYSSKEANQLLIDAGVPQKKRRTKGRLDQAAAAHILQQFLDENPDL
ncbi:MAG: Holliday junction resolvase RuvX [Balneolaceae bacterium]